MAVNYHIPAILLIFITRLISSTNIPTPWNILLPPNLLSLDLAERLSSAPSAVESASHDFGHIVRKSPSAVLYPSSPSDIENLLKFAAAHPVPPFTIAARGCGHSTRGQAMVNNGIVVNMKSLIAKVTVSSSNVPSSGLVAKVVGGAPVSSSNPSSDIVAEIGGGGLNARVTVSSSNPSSVKIAFVADVGEEGIIVSFSSPSSGFVADVGGGELWIDVLNETLKYGLAPVSWTDYLHLSVGGTLSNAGISGQTFRYGPQISNVYEMDVINGKGEFVTCSSKKNSELFYAVLGGLGQFGIITRARIPLQPAPKRVKWVRMLYSDFSTFTRDQEHLISIIGAVDYLEGSIMMDHGSPDNWRSSFFPPSDYSRIISLVTKHGVIYCLEIVKHYDDQSLHTINKELEQLIKGLSFIRGLMFERDVSYVEFLDRVRGGELKLKSQGQWDVPHPWLNLFIPKSSIKKFNDGVFRNIVLKRNMTNGPLLLYPMNRNKWDDRMSAMIPDEEVFYTVGFLHSSGYDDFGDFEEQNKEILMFCEEAGIEVKQYLTHYGSEEEWRMHFGSKWSTFVERKNMFDPKCLLSPGQNIFKSNI